MRKPPQGGVYQASELSQQMSTSENLNAMKNYSLYTSQIGHEFFKPSESIDDQTATACVSRARELLQIYQRVYSAIFELTGMTEEGLRRCIEMPEFQMLLQLLGSNADLSHFPVLDKQQAVVGITAFFNEPTIQSLLAQFPSAIEQDLQSLKQAENQTPQDRQQAL